MELPAAALAVAAALALAVPAADAATYSGKTSGGTKITFKVSGSTIKKVDTIIPTMCLPTTGGSPRAGSDSYRPPGSFKLGGGEQKAKELQPSAMHSSEVTKHYRFTPKRGKGGAITGKLHMSFSFLTLSYGSTIGTVPWICQGDATFKAKRR